MILKELEKKIIDHLKSENEQVHYISLLYSILNKYEESVSLFEIHKKIINSIELLKASTLIIDDIIDNTDERDNSDSFIKSFGINNSILVGELLKSHSTITFIEGVNSLPISETNKINSILIFEDSYRTVLQGQYEDVNALYYRKEMRTWDKSQWEEYFNQYLSIIYSTTSVFLQIPFLVNVELGNINVDELQFYTKYFQLMGVGYQLRDDIIDSIGTDGESGKQLGGDIVEKKVRLPLILFLRDTVDIVLKNKILDILEMNPNEIALYANYIIDELYNSDSVKSSIEFLNSVCDDAIVSINNIKNEEHKKDLVNIAKFLKF